MVLGDDESLDRSSTLARHIFSGSLDQTVDAGAAPTSIALDPSGKFAYVGNSGSLNVSMYSINADGMLTPLVPATIGL